MANYIPTSQATRLTSWMQSQQLQDARNLTQDVLNPLTQTELLQQFVIFTLTSVHNNRID